MATHTSILAWRIPWTEEPGGPWSIGSQRIKHDWFWTEWLNWLTDVDYRYFHMNMLLSGFSFLFLLFLPFRFYGEYYVSRFWGFPGGNSGKEPTCQCWRHKRFGLIPGSGRSTGGGHGNSHQYSCLGNLRNRGPWGATVHGVKKSQTKPKRLSTHARFLMEKVSFHSGC